MYILVVEVASGEYGCHTPQLAAAVTCGKCDQRDSLGTGATKALDIGEHNLLTLTSQILLIVWDAIFDSKLNNLLLEQTRRSF